MKNIVQGFKNGDKTIGAPRMSPAYVNHTAYEFTNPGILNGIVTHDKYKIYGFAAWNPQKLQMLNYGKVVIPFKLPIFRLAGNYTSNFEVFGITILGDGDTFALNFLKVHGKYELTLAFDAEKQQAYIADDFLDFTIGGFKPKLGDFGGMDKDLYESLMAAVDENANVMMSAMKPFFPDEIAKVLKSGIEPYIRNIPADLAKELVDFSKE
jgi:hypothetical protein